MVGELVLGVRGAAEAMVSGKDAWSRGAIYRKSEEAGAWLVANLRCET
jgi:hypothetical protein